MATGAPSASGRSSRAAYLTLHSLSKKRFGRGVEPPLFFSNGNKRWLDCARHDSLIWWDIPPEESCVCFAVANVTIPLVRPCGLPAVHQLSRFVQFRLHR